MDKYVYTPQGVCSRQITFGVEDDKIHDLSFVGGCDGNLKAVGKLVEGQDIHKIADILRGNDCVGRGTSCVDQLARALDSVIESENN